MKEIKGFYWPDSDADCHRAVFDETYKIDKALSLTQGRSVCIQAGGNVGVFPKILAKSFNAVYTWEPDPENFTCLAMNCPEPNIVKFNAALGSHPDMIHVGSPNRQHNNNCGAYQVLGKGIYPTMLVDDLALPACDLIYLDIEGFELFAIQGAYSTIKKFHPVIVIENKPLPITYDISPEQVVDFLINEFGYQIAAREMRDIFFV